MNKNILIIGVARVGKTSLAKKISKEKGYNLICIDDIVSGFEEYKELNIHHDGDRAEVSKRLVPFLKRYFKELSENSTYYGGIRCVIEGTYFDFEELVPYLRSDGLKDKYTLIGLTFNDLTEQQLFDDIRKNDTDDEWTYYCDDEELKGNVRYFLETNKYFNDMFNKYEIKTFDTSKDREKVFGYIVDNLEDL